LKHGKLKEGERYEKVIIAGSSSPSSVSFRAFFRASLLDSKGRQAMESGLRRLRRIWWTTWPKYEINE
jgi:hypothetical protein